MKLGKSTTALVEARMGRVMLLGVVLAVLQQWSAANVLFNYAEEVFKAAGYDISDVLANIALTGVVNLIFTFVALGVVDRGGRRPLMLLGSAGLAVLYTAIGGGYALGLTGWPMLVLVLSVICCYSMSLAPVTWVVISEIFPNRIRGAAMAVAVSALWIACFILTYTFPLLIDRLGAAHLLALRRHLRRGFCVHFPSPPRNQGQDVGKNRIRTRWLTSYNQFIRVDGDTFGSATRPSVSAATNREAGFIRSFPISNSTRCISLGGSDGSNPTPAPTSTSETSPPESDAATGGNGQ